MACETFLCLTHHNYDGITPCSYRTDVNTPWNYTSDETATESYTSDETAPWNYTIDETTPWNCTADVTTTWNYATDGTTLDSLICSFRSASSRNYYNTVTVTNTFTIIPTHCILLPWYQPTEFQESKSQMKFSSSIYQESSFPLAVRLLTLSSLTGWSSINFLNWHIMTFVIACH